MKSRSLGDKVILQYQETEEKNTVRHYPAGQCKGKTAGSRCGSSRG